MTLIKYTVHTRVRERTPRQEPKAARAQRAVSRKTRRSPHTVYVTAAGVLLEDLQSIGKESSWSCQPRCRLHPPSGIEVGDGGGWDGWDGGGD